MDEQMKQERAAAVAVLLRLSPSIRDALTSDLDFMRASHIETDTVVSLGVNSPSFKRSSLFGAIRLLSTIGEDRELLGLGGEACRLSLKADGAGVVVDLRTKHRQYLLQDLWPLLLNKDHRLDTFANVANAVNLPQDSHNHWQTLLSESALRDEQCVKLMDDLENTPTRWLIRLQKLFSIGQLEPSDLVPREMRFFDRLVGDLGEVTSLEELHAKTRALTRELINWSAVSGPRLALLLGSHTENVDWAPFKKLDKGNTRRILQFAASADPQTQLAALELALSRADADEDIESSMLGLIRGFSQVEASKDLSHFELFSSVLRLVEGEFIRTRLFASRSPLVRRAAAYAHTALITQCFLLSGRTDGEDFARWARDTGAAQYYLQCLVDMRVAPRWHPEYSEADGLRNELLGRMIGTANKYREIITEKVREVILGEKEGSLLGDVDFFASARAGPLEGAQKSPQRAPEILESELRESLSAEQVDPSAFTLLVNASVLFDVGVDKAELAAKCLKSLRYRLDSGDTPDDIYGLVMGLAQVSAVTRNPGLADEVRILARRCRVSSPTAFSGVNALPIGLIAAASDESLPAWCKRVGAWVTELAYLCSNREEAASLLASLNQLMHCSSELWTTCGRGITALRALEEH